MDEVIKKRIEKIENPDAVRLFFRLLKILVDELDLSPENPKLALTAPKGQPHLVVNLNNRYVLTLDPGGAIGFMVHKADFQTLQRKVKSSDYGRFSRDKATDDYFVIYEPKILQKEASLHEIVKVWLSSCKEYEPKMSRSPYRNKHNKTLYEIATGVENLDVYLYSSSTSKSEIDFFTKEDIDMKPDYYVQYHNADEKGQYPFGNPDFATPITSVSLDNSVKYGSQFYTKKNVEKAVGQFCFLIVGKTEKKIKKYCLWSFCKIEDFAQDDDGFYEVEGTGYDFETPMLLNDLALFQDFKNFCGNFGLGFLKINNHGFCKTLISLASSRSLDLSKKRAVNSQSDLDFALQQLNKEMQKVRPTRRLAEIEQILRKDGKIVKLLKKAADYKCQFPDCDSQVLTRTGNNYVEVAHVKPVNEGGQSIIGNLLVLCPNHHKEFDYGTLEIEKQTDKRLVGTLNGKKFVINQK